MTYRGVRSLTSALFCRICGAWRDLTGVSVGPMWHIEESGRRGVCGSGNPLCMRVSSNVSADISIRGGWGVGFMGGWDGAGGFMGGWGRAEVL